MTRQRRLSLAAAIVGIGILIDQLTKAWAKSALGSGRVISIVPTLEFDLTFNSGFSFGTGSGRSQLIGGIVVLISLLLIWQIVRETRGRRTVLMAVILAGALGNLGDRAFRADDGILSGHVVDFIDVTWYAVFNLADMFVVLGAIALVLDEILHERLSRVRENPESQETTPDRA